MFSSFPSETFGIRLSRAALPLLLKWDGKNYEHGLSSSTMTPSTLQAFATSSLQKKVLSSSMKARPLVLGLMECRWKSILEVDMPQRLPTASCRNISSLAIISSFLSKVRCLRTTCSQKSPRYLRTVDHLEIETPRFEVDSTKYTSSGSVPNLRIIATWSKWEFVKVLVSFEPNWRHRKRSRSPVSES
ncbi:hypothetical protein FGO68_gene9367 [Halteria grandinella]|uniref:Uncharacterized protein n=1 Tax=Halteria grandinella TaxID=5974 RepID=A0A8J8NQA6_HALGN|nr:hypothetical protein FGO68_gene9367 [Halteria grandinella]